jgi:hypothetical protein
VIAATAILVSGSQSESKLDKPALLIPLYAAGGVLTAMGIGFQIASDTEIEDQKPRRGGPPTALGLTASFQF